MKKLILLLLILLPTILIGCVQSAPNNNPRWVNDLVATYEKDPVGNPPQSILQFEFKGQVVYFVPAQCYDQFSKLFDSAGGVICAPDGGFTGHGDGKCTDFFQLRTNEKLIWQDPRTR